MTRMTKRLKDGQVAMDCIACAKQGVVCHLLSCRNRLKNRLCDYEDVMQSNRLVEQKHGRWEKPSKHGFSKTMDKLGGVCSACSEWNDNETNYCPNCGAKMDGDTE